jgi:hypothetical protein
VGHENVEQAVAPTGGLGREGGALGRQVAHSSPWRAKPQLAGLHERSVPGGSARSCASLPAAVNDRSWPAPRPARRETAYGKKPRRISRARPTRPKAGADS